MSESSLTRALTAKLTAYGAEVYPLIGSTLAPTAWPDRYVAHELWQGFIECKLSGKWLNKAQQQRCERLLKRRVNVVVCIVDTQEIYSVSRERLFEFQTVQELLCKLSKK